jgi:hypothetical protein
VRNTLHFLWLILRYGGGRSVKNTSHFIWLFLRSWRRSLHHLNGFRRNHPEEDYLQTIIESLGRAENPSLLRMKDRLSEIQANIQTLGQGRYREQKILNGTFAAWFVSRLETVPKQIPGPAVSFKVSVQINRPKPATQQSVSLPAVAQHAVIFLLLPKRRDDVLNDIWDWYPALVKDKPRTANFYCLWKIALAAVGQGLDVLYRIAEIVGKFRGR